VGMDQDCWDALELVTVSIPLSGAFLLWVESGPPPEGGGREFQSP